MAPTSHGKGHPNGRESFANGYANNGQPPPSTLAAQLVENISTSAKSSRPDETAELKKFFSIIEKVKDQPGLLKTPTERKDHNHMLIYVYSRVVLEGLKWDDLFVSKDQLKKDALRAVNFLNVTIKETPEVLLATAEPGSFLFRGDEPLWIWTFPKILKLLGLSHCADLTDAIESFFRDVFLTVSRCAALWIFLPQFLDYIRLNIKAIYNALEDMKAPVKVRDLPLNLRLPSNTFLESLSCSDLQIVQQNCTYSLSLASHALRHTQGLLSIAMIPLGLLSSYAGPSLISCFQESVPWIVDACLQLHQMDNSWQSLTPDCLTSLLTKATLLPKQLEDAGNVDVAVHQKIYILLALLCVPMADRAGAVPSPTVNMGSDRLFCSAIVVVAGGCLKFRPISRLVVAQLLPALQKLMIADPGLDGTDLWRCTELLKTVAVDPLSASLTPPVQLEQFTDEELRRHIKALQLGRRDNATDERHPKRRKTDEKLTLLKLISHINQLLEIESQPKLSELGTVFLNRFPGLPEPQKCKLIRLLGFVSCAADDTLLMTNTQNRIACRFCDALPSASKPPICINIEARDVVQTIFTSLIQLPNFSESSKLRVATMVALRHAVLHCTNGQFLDIECSVAAQWCLKSLQSSCRELRIAAGRTLAAFLSGSKVQGSDLHTITSNRANVLAILRTVSEKNEPHLTETLIMAWSQVARVVSEDELNLVLVKLMEYLGHESTAISAVAFTEIIKMAKSRGVPPRRLFEPNWQYLAYTTVKDVVSRPKLTRLLAEVLTMTVTELLLYVQSHALPWLVVTKRKDVIQKIAEVRNESETWQPCLDNINLGRILALLLTQEVQDVEQHAVTILRHVSPHFDGFSLVDLLRIEPMMTSLELLKAAGDADEARKPHVRNALSLMADIMLRDSGDNKQKKSHKAGQFLQQYALGLVARLTDTINDATIRSPMQERRRCIKAMEEMVRAGKGYVRIARPQLSACILAAMAQDELRSVAFSCWSAMLLYLEEEDIGNLIETTFFVITDYWPSFDQPTHQQCRQLIERLLEDEHASLRDVIQKLPSLSHITELSDLESRLGQMRTTVDSHEAFLLLAQRLRHENGGVVLQALRELASYLQMQQGYLQASAVSEQPDSVVSDLVRALLDCAAKYNDNGGEIGDLCAQCLGLVGCLDPNRIEAVRDEKHIVVLSNFEDSGETTDFVVFLLDKVLVKSFLSATDTKLLGFLSYVMQELLDRCDIKAAVQMGGTGNAAPVYRKFLTMSEGTREVLIPFMSSRYMLAPMPIQDAEYPLFRPGKPYGNWMRNITLDCLRHPQNAFAQLLFEPLCRVIRVKDLTIAEFLFPFVVLHVIIGEEISEEQRACVVNELQSVVRHELPANATYAEREQQKLYCEAIFRFLDYCMRWYQMKSGQPNTGSRDKVAMRKVRKLLESIPAELTSQRAMDCGAYSRALFHWEQHIRQVDSTGGGGEDRDRLLQKLQDIYTEIDEPDGLEGISAHLRVIDINQQILSHRKAGRWAAAQPWYEIQLAKEPDNADIQMDLLTCLKESGQHDVLLNYVEGIEKHTASAGINRIVPYAVEAAWATGRWKTMEKFIRKYQGDRAENFNVSVAQALLHLHKGWTQGFVEEMKTMRGRVSSSMTFSATASLQTCHESLLKSHVLTDLELVAGINNETAQHPQDVLKSLGRRLEVLGSYVSDKQYVIGIRRAAMELMRPRFGDFDISALWLTSARLARKSDSMHQSFNAVLHASQLGDDSARIENARLLWKEGHHRKAIQTLQGAIASNVFANRSFHGHESSEKNFESQKGMLTARAQLLLAKWLDHAGQTHVTALREQYREVPKNYGTWEKGHYYLGRHYKKILESEKLLKPDEQSDEYLTGETAKLVIENYLRSLNYGTKYLYQTLPRILTLWLEMGAQIDKAPEGKVSLSRELYQRRKSQLAELHKYLNKNISRLPAYIFYTALPQLVARIAHPHSEVFMLLEAIIIRVVEAHPRQSLWSLFGIMTSRQATSDRRTRGHAILQKLRSNSKKVEAGSYDIKSLLRMGEKLADQLLLACNNGDFQSNRTTVASITRDLHFNHKCTPCPLVVPIETCLTATLPTLTDNLKRHKAFSREIIHIQSFLDEVLVLGSLAKPRRLTARGSDGVNYGLLIKPKDDLRTDQRLMEFNSMINRSLKRDAESSRRQLYIRTYAVTPLNEECGIIEWVHGLKTLRDILLGIYRSQGIVPNYGQLAQQMKDAATGGSNTRIFTEGVLRQFPPILPNWFIAQFPNPSAWFAARLRYTRSCAVMSMVGTILGLGDRHGENVLLEEGNGGVFHVDFNCLFDKGLTFAQPERVPFRLTHNMVAAMGIYGYEGPFRQCSELTLGILRQQEETLMTILEAFIYDPTLDLQRDKRRKNEVVRLNPQSVVESIKRKVRGLLPDESIPLGVEGQVEELIKQAVDPKNLSGMYIGWCPFL
ncbi:phosphatidyl inositol 3-kinase-like protein [Xylariomycetidae sp. FL2044]|nr:phosphatidyl inositol 3-kinase-like protein [Xylariomycetidae sp. FL2044]